jgi:hypothetical protein
MTETLEVLPVDGLLELMLLSPLLVVLTGRMKPQLPRRAEAELGPRVLPPLAGKGQRSFLWLTV